MRRSRSTRLAVAAALLTCAAATAPGAASAAATWLPAQSIGPGGAFVALADDGSATAMSFPGGSAEEPLSTASRPARGTWGPTSALTPSAEGAVVAVEQLPDGTAVALIVSGAAASYGLGAATRAPGQPWSAMQQLNLDGEPVDGETRTAVAADGTLTVAWSDASSGLRTVERRPNGTWSAVQTVPLTRGPRFSLAVAPDGGAIIATHTNGVPARVDVSQRPRGGTWSAVETLATPSTPSASGVTIAPDGQRLVFWGEASPTTIAYRTSQPDGSWGPTVTGPAPVGASVDLLRPIFDAAGDLTVVWGDGVFKNPLTIRAATRTGAGWSATSTLSAPDSASQETGFAVARAGDALLVGWTQRQVGGFVARRSGGAWEPATQLSTGTSGITNLSVLPDGDAMAGLVTVTSASPFTAVSSTRALDANGPRIGAIQAPGATAGSPATVSVEAVDRLSEIGSVVWDFGDWSTGTSTGTATITHTWAQPGTYTVKVTATDAVGNSTSGQGTVTVTAAPTPTPAPTPAPTPGPTPARAPAPELKLLADGFGKQLLLGKRRIPVVLSCGRFDCSVRLRATLLVGKRTVGTLPAVRGTIAARKKRTFFLETTVAQRRTMRAAVRRGRDAAVRVRVTATTSAGTSQATQRISLRDLG